MISDLHFKMTVVAVLSRRKLARVESGSQLRYWGNNLLKDDAWTRWQLWSPSREVAMFWVVRKASGIYKEIGWWCERIPMASLVWGIGRLELPSAESWKSVGGDDEGDIWVRNIRAC